MLEWAFAKFVLKHWRVFVLLAAIAGLFAAGYAVKAKIDAREDELVALQAQNADLKLKVGQGKVNERVVTKYVDRVTAGKVITHTIIKEVPIYVPADSPVLPPGFRVLHDAAAKGELPDPARIADAAPVPAQDAAETIAGNYGQCHETESQLTALQEWIRAQQALAK